VKHRPAIFLALTLGLGASRSAPAHEMRPAFLEVRETAPEVYDVLWRVPALGDRRMPLTPSFAPDIEQIAEPVGGFRAGGYVERFRFRRPGGLSGTTITIDGLSATFTDALLRFERADGTLITRRLTPERPSTIIDAESGPAATFLILGIEPILSGFDHLLFVLGLLFIVQGTWMLTKTITAFTLAHSLTLAAATLGYAYPPADLLNVLIASSILFLGPEMLRAERGESSLTLRWPWIVAFAFGLLHGFGFASGLNALGLPQREIPLALLSFNVGVELGQLGFVAILIALGWALRVLEFEWSPRARTVPAYVVGSLGAWWTVDRLIALWTVGSNVTA
jgi:hypothetical protein